MSNTNLATHDALTVERAARGRCELVGRIKRFLFSDDLSGAVILAVDCHTEGGEVRVRGNVIQGCARLDVGSEYKWYGKWTYHEKHGDQFLFTTYLSHFSPTKDGIVRYLQSNVPGVGIRRAFRLWDNFEADTITILRTQPQLVADAGIMSLEEATRAGQVLAAASEHDDLRLALDSLLSGYGFPRKIVKACEEKYGPAAINIIRADPYRLMVDGMPGAGFKRCDALYLKLDLPPDAVTRQMWAAWHALKTSASGNTWCVAGVALKAIVDCVGKLASKYEDAIAEAKKKRLIATRTDDAGREWLAEAKKAEDERDCARHIARLRSHTATLWPTREELAMIAPAVSQHQLTEVEKISGSSFAILAGTPGTGKTFTAAAILRFVVQRIGSHNIRVAAPTGKAAVRITEAMRRNGVEIEATTIHRLLGVNEGGFQFNESTPLEVSVVVVDEVSMLDTWLAASLFAALPTGTHVLLIGDPYQLAPVGHGAPLRDMIAAGVPCGLLTEIQRNAGRIVEACAKIKDGKKFATSDKYEPDKGENLRWFEASTPAEQVEILRSILGAMKQFNPIWGVQVLCARNEVTPVSRVALNKILQAMLDPPPVTNEGDAPPERMQHPYRLGDKIICLKNCWLNGFGVELPSLDHAHVDSYVEIRDETGQIVKSYLANGEIGRVVAVAPQWVVMRFEEPARVVKMLMREGSGGEDADSKKGGASDFALAYAITTHKAQGSEAPCVIVMVDDGAGWVASREFHYTAISRAKQLCIVIGRRSAFDRQVRRVALSERKTFLAELLRGGSAPAKTTTIPPVAQAATMVMTQANESVPL